ncbi:MAG: hypothetical protein ABW184_00215 [Sphingobium sp.]
MTDPLRLRVHVSEPFDFERENDSADLFGSTLDHAGGDTDSDDTGEDDEWEVALESGFRFNEADYTGVLVSPRYVGEHLSRVHGAMLGMPVRIAHRTDEGWHFAMTGLLSLAPPLIPDIAQSHADQDPAPTDPTES